MAQFCWPLTSAWVVDGVAKHVRVIGKGNKERQVPLPESFGRVLALSLIGKTQDENMCSPKKPEGGKPPGAHATRAYLKEAGGGYLRLTTIIRNGLIQPGSILILSKDLF